MSLPESRANRRRRWWLRAQAALARLGPFTKVPNTEGRSPRAVPKLTDWELWRQASQLPHNVQLELYHGGTGQRLLLPISEPRLIVGADQHCDVRLLEATATAPQIAFLWLTGQLYRVDLSGDVRRWHDAVHQVTQQDRWKWGPWIGRVLGPLEAEFTPFSRSDLRLELNWNAAGPQSPVEIDREITWIGSARGCDLRLSGDDAAPIQAVLLRTSERLFVVSLGPPGSTRVNGRAAECAVLEAGDALSIGQQVAWLTVHWTAAEDSRTPLEVAPPNESTFTIAWQSYLQQQAAHLRELQALRQNSQPTAAETAQLAALQALLAAQPPERARSSGSLSSSESLAVGQ